jgi:hypothetical protein
MYNGVHFRVEFDAIVHYLFSRNCYDHFMETKNINLINIPEVKSYIENLITQYIHFIKYFGFQLPWFISTLVGKKEIHNPLMIYLKQITDLIESNGGTWFMSEQRFEQRELNAIVDLLLLRDCNNMIGFEGSSFSEGYCYKVNLIRNPLKQYKFVNGITKKLSDGIYKSC